MASSEPEIKDGFKLPVWMKTKPVKEFEVFPGSPPGPEDSFFYMKYPKTDALFAKPKTEQDLSKALTDQLKETTAVSAFKDKDWSKHTKPCQDVLHGIAPINTIAGTATPKPAGTDDGFKGEGAACGSSIVKVASEMMSKQGRGFTVAAPSEEPEPPPRAHQLQRRGSKSLPTTPQTSPRARRRQIADGNRYFTSPFEQTEDGSGRSWLTMALLGFKKDLTTSTSTLTEEEIVDNRLQGGSLAESVENLGPSPKSKLEVTALDAPAQQPKLNKPTTHGFRPKPTELRELNFWSPTSM